MKSLIVIAITLLPFQLRCSAQELDDRREKEKEAL